jgi:hypothetical protein
MPLRMKLPDSAAAPVSGETTPMRIASAALAMIAGAPNAMMPPKTALRRLMSIMRLNSSPSRLCRAGSGPFVRLP